jgi:Flp pilus assembly protein TadD
VIRALAIASTSIVAISTLLRCAACIKAVKPAPCRASMSPASTGTQHDGMSPPLSGWNGRTFETNVLDA